MNFHCQRNIHNFTYNIEMIHKWIKWRITQITFLDVQVFIWFLGHKKRIKVRTPCTHTLIHSITIDLYGFFLLLLCIQFFFSFLFSPSLRDLNLSLGLFKNENLTRFSPFLYSVLFIERTSERKCANAFNGANRLTAAVWFVTFQQLA